MEQSVATHLIVTISESHCRAGHQQETRRLYGTAGHDDMAGALHARTRVVRVGDIEIAHTGGAAGPCVIDDFISLRIRYYLRIGQIPKLFDSRKTAAGFWPFLPPAEIFAAVPTQVACATHAVGPYFLRRLLPERT